jgi:hypothetical protein
MMAVFVPIATIVYAATMSLGILAATTSRRFGRLHHMAFFTTCATSLIAAVTTPSWFMAGTLCCLAAMPFCPSRLLRHRIVGSLGLVFLVMALI